MDSQNDSVRPELRLTNLSLCPKCDQKAREIEKLYDREIKNLHYLLNFKDLAVRKRDDMVLKYVEEINKLKETIKNMNKLIYRLKLQIPDPKNLSKNQSNNYMDTFENELPVIRSDNNRPFSSNQRLFSANILRKNQSNPIVKIKKAKDKKICVTATQGMPLQQSLLNDKNRKSIVMMEEAEEKKVLKDPKLKQLEDFFMKNENCLETFSSLKTLNKMEFFENSFSVLRDFKTTITQSLRLKKLIKYFQKVMKTLSYQENFFVITKYTSDILDCEKSTLFIVDEENQELWTKFKPEDSSVFRIPITTGIIGYVASNNQMIRVDDANCDPRFNKDIDNHQHNYHLKTLLAVPIRDSEGKIIGVLEAVNKLNSNFNTEDEEFISLISQQANIVLKNCTNFEKLVGNIYKLQKILKVQMKMVEIEDFEEFQTFVEKALLDLTNSSQTSIFFVNHTKKILIKFINSNDIEVNQLELGIIGEVVRCGEQIFVANAQNHPKFNILVDFKSNLPIHTYPVKGNNGDVIAVVQILKFHDMLGRKIKRDPNDEEIFSKFLSVLSVFYEKMKFKLKFLE